MNPPDEENDLRELEPELIACLRREIEPPRWRGRLRRRMRRERWARRCGTIALLLQVSLAAVIAAAFHPWNWPAAGVRMGSWDSLPGVPWAMVALAAILLAAVLYGIFWSERMRRTR